MEHPYPAKTAAAASGRGRPQARALRPRTRARPDSAWSVHRAQPRVRTAAAAALKQSRAKPRADALAWRQRRMRLGERAPARLAAKAALAPRQVGHERGDRQIAHAHDRALLDRQRRPAAPPATARRRGQLTPNNNPASSTPVTSLQRFRRRRRPPHRHLAFCADARVSAGEHETPGVDDPRAYTPASLEKAGVRSPRRFRHTSGARGGATSTAPILEPRRALSAVPPWTRPRRSSGSEGMTESTCCGMRSGTGRAIGRLAATKPTAARLARPPSGGHALPRRALPDTKALRGACTSPAEKDSSVLRHRLHHSVHHR